MKKLLIFISFLFSMSAFAQTSFVNNNYKFGVDVGYSQNGYMPASLYIGVDRMQYGISVAYPINSGQKGKYYSNINWDEFSSEIVKSGNFYYPFTFDVGYHITDKFVIGAGIGYSMKILYRNMYDNAHILGNNGSYYITKSDGGQVEYKAFLSYYFPSFNTSSFYIKGFYSKAMGVGASFGTEF